jgi:hypothetical protein
MDLNRELDLHLTRRQLFSLGAKGVGAAALAALFKQDGFAFGQNESRDPKTGGLIGLPHHAPKAKRVIFLHQSGGPSQIETFDYKPALEKLHGTELPDSIRRGQRITGMTSGQSAFPCVKSLFSYKQYGQSGTWVSELLPHTAKIVDEIAVIKSRIRISRRSSSCCRPPTRSTPTSRSFRASGRAVFCRRLIKAYDCAAARRPSYISTIRPA